MKLAATGDLHGRSVTEWIGKTPDSKPPKAVVDRVLLRQGSRCKVSKRRIRPGDATQCDHIIRLKDGGENRETNLQILLVETHREKTAVENKQGAKERRTRLKHLGLWPKSRVKIQSRGFEKRNAP